MSHTSESDDAGSQSLSPAEDSLPSSLHPAGNPPQPRRASRPSDITPQSRYPSRNHNELTDVGTHRALPTSGASLDRRPSFADYMRNALPGDPFDAPISPRPTAASSQVSRMREPRPAEDRTTVVPAAASSSHQTTARRNDTNEHDIELETRSRVGQPRIREDDRQRVYAPPVSSSSSSGTSASKEVPPLSRTQNVLLTRTSHGPASDPSFGLHKTEELGERHQSSVPQVDSSREKKAIKLHAQQVDRTISVQPSAKSSTHSAPPLNRPGISMSSSLSRIAPAMTRPTSSSMPAPRGMHSDEPQTRPGEAPSGVSRPPGQGKGNTYPDQQSYSNPSAASYRPPLPPGRAITKTDPPLPPKPESVAHRLGRSKSRINEGVEPEVTMPGVEPPTSEKKERKHTAAAEGRETYREDSVTGSYGTSSREAESTPANSHGSHFKHYPQTPPESSVERTSTLGRESDSGLVRLPDAGKTRGKVDRPADLAPSLDRRETSTIPPASLSTRNQPKHVIGIPSNNDSTNSGVNRPSQPSNVLGGSQLRTAPSMSRSMTSRSFAPSASRIAQREGGATPGSIMGSNSMRPVRQPELPPVPLDSLDRSLSTETLRGTGGGTSSRLPGNHSETNTSSPAHVDSTHETIEDRRRGKSSDRQGIVQPSAQTPPAIVRAPSNVREEQGSQPQHGRFPSELPPLHSQYENRGAPSNGQHHAAPTSTTQGEIPSAEHPSPTGTSSRFHVRPFSGLLLTPVDAEGITEQTISLDLDQANVRPVGVPNLGRDPPPPPYELKASQRVSSTQEGTSSGPSRGVSREVRNESTTTSAPESINSSPNPIGQSRVDISTESETHSGLLPTSVHTSDENKATVSLNEQEHMDPSREINDLLRSSERPAMISSSSQHRSQPVVAYRAEASPSSEAARIMQRRGSVNPSNIPNSNFRQGNTSNGSTSPRLTLDILPDNSQDPRMEIRTRVAGETITSQSSHLMASPLERDGGQSTRGRSRPSQAGQPTPTTAGAPLGLDRTVSVASRSPGRPQQPPQPSHTDNDTSHPRPSVEHRPALSRDFPSRHDRSTPRVDDTHASRERPSESRPGLNVPPQPPLALSHLQSHSARYLLDSGSSTAASRGPPTNAQHVQPRHRPSLSPQSHRIVTEQPLPQSSLEVPRSNEAVPESASRAARRAATVRVSAPQRRTFLPNFLCGFCRCNEG